MKAQVFALLLLVCFACKKPEKQVPVKNVLLIVADDLGWADLGAYGSTFYETPNIDALIGDGIKYTNGYAACPVCSPSRVSIQTGLYPTKAEVTDWIPGRASYKGPEPENRWLGNDIANELALSHETIAEALLRHGYRTFFAGKWHLGEKEAYWPEHQGYETNKGGFSRGRPNINRKKGANGYFSPYDNPRLEDGPEGEYLTDRLADETISFINQHKNEPFFINLSFYQVHTPLQAKEAYLKKYMEKRKALGNDTINELDLSPAWKAGHFAGNAFKERFVQAHPVYAGMVQSMDDNVGRIADKLKELGLYDNTLIIFTSDNGGLSTAEGSPTANLPLRAGKGWLYEGGIRVPMAIKGFGREKAGITDATPASGIDIYPTIMGVLGLEGAATTDGVALLQSGDTERPLFWHYPHYSNQGGHPGSAIRKGRYKLIHDFETGEKLLYDLESDLGETQNLAVDMPQQAAMLYRELDNWRKQANAKMMRPNPIWNQNEKTVE